MIRHIVWWTLKPEAQGRTAMENAQLIKEQGLGLLAKVPSLKSIEISHVIKETTTLPVQLVLTSTHDDMAGLKAYAEHPAHMELVELVKAVVDSRQALDFEV